MATSYCSITVHIIFGTKDRFRYLTDDVFSYIHGIIHQLDGIPISINGTDDHIHILCNLPKSMTVPEFVRVIKANSSKWFKDKNANMAWQTGYAAFSVSKTNIPAIQKYIMAQKEHHHRVTFAEEMQKYMVEEGGSSVWNEWFG
ncbi:MAG: transposase [Candidatus Cloacimonetes bacterium HGW-Cloacimonetes-1]|nr:MAG: transposase [Candidatus Cloacimonetes bacterium HGW-Cloacimonetes-1]